jgi:hypothetical protein
LLLLQPLPLLGTHRTVTTNSHTDRRCRTFAALKALDLSRIQRPIPDADFASALRQLAGLSSLTVGGPGCSMLRGEALEAVGGLTRLRSLAVHGCRKVRETAMHACVRVCRWQ